MVNDGYRIIIWLVVGIPTPLKNDGVSSSVGMIFLPNWMEKQKFMVQTTNQCFVTHVYPAGPASSLPDSSASNSPKDGWKSKDRRRVFKGGSLSIGRGPGFC